MGKFAFIATGYIIDYDGISVYIENLLKNLLLHSSLKNKELSLDIYIAESAKTVFIERIFSKNKYENIHILTIKDNNPILKMIHLQYMLLLNRNYTVVFMPNPMPLFLSAGKRIKVVHDLTIKKTPKFFSQKMHRYIDFLIWYMRRFDDAIGYISNQTKADIKQFYQIGEANKKMIHLPNGIPFKVLDTPRPKISNILEKYEQKSIEFVIVGRINRAKGFDRILKFLNYFENYLQNEHNFINVIVHVVGKQTIETREILNEAKLQKIHLQFHGFVDDKTLNNLYIKSHFCFFLSRNEGYGLPLVEA
ncbi:MAG TPA: glycosyltransferase, partial [Saprospiraceae bacterium]|nr:glycosyltransferase [Saprospiraceae bacterium]